MLHIIYIYGDCEIKVILPFKEWKNDFVEVSKNLITCVARISYKGNLYWIYFILYYLFMSN